LSASFSVADVLGALRDNTGVPVLASVSAAADAMNVAAAFFVGSFSVSF
jgi:hypothetical protein